MSLAPGRPSAEPKVRIANPTLCVGQVWAAREWVVLVLEVRERPPEDKRRWYLAHRSDTAVRMAESPHAFCLVLADDQMSWPPGSTRWIDENYMLTNAEEVPA